MNAPPLASDRFRVIVGDCREALRALPRESVHCVVTSPPYWQLRKYSETDADPIGLEATPQLFVKRIVHVMRLVRRVLRKDGTLWLNLGDTYMGAPAGGQGKNGQRADRRVVDFPKMRRGGAGLKEKDLVGIPWRVALALQADGWWLRSEIIWHKPAPMPESVRDRPTRAHEYMFLLSKSPEYFYDADAIRTPVADSTRSTYGDGIGPGRVHAEKSEGLAARKRAPKTASDGTVLGANKRSVWSIASRPWVGEHTSTFPPDLVEPCILAGCPAGGTVLDPFVGSGTTIVKAMELGRFGIGIDNDPNALAEIEMRAAGTQLRLIGCVPPLIPTSDAARRSLRREVPPGTEDVAAGESALPRVPARRSPIAPRFPMTMLSCSHPDDLFAIRVARHRAIGDALLDHVGGVRERVTNIDGETTLVMMLDGEVVWVGREERRGPAYVWAEDFIPRACPQAVVDACKVGDLEVASLNVTIKGWELAPMLRMLGANGRAKFYVSAHRGEIALIGSGDTATGALDELRWRIDRETEVAA